MPEHPMSGADNTQTGGTVERTHECERGYLRCWEDKDGLWMLDLDQNSEPSPMRINFCPMCGYEEGDSRSGRTP